LNEKNVRWRHMMLYFLVFDPLLLVAYDPLFFGV